MNEENLSLLLQVARPMRPMVDEVLFVGGVVTALLITDPASPEVRVTVDVDIVVEVASYGRYQAVLARLGGLGFVADVSEDAHTARLVGHGVVLDVMPSQGGPGLGGINRWYAPAFHWAQTLALADDLNIRVISAPDFVATKLEAFNARGRADPYMSRDFADIVSVLEGRPELLEEVRARPAALQDYIASEAGGLLAEAQLRDWVGAALPMEASARETVVLARLRALAALR